MPGFIISFLAVSSAVAFLLFYFAISDIAENLSPQGCRMSWMSPSYVLQAEFNESWSPLTRRYSLWLYREVGWDPLQGPGVRKDSLPVLFIPGNAGSSHQVRSIASSASRQYFESPYVVSSAFESRSSKPLDFFAVEFNEDLSAFHGSTLESQITYTSKAISYILSLYPPDTSIVVMGHSMGGIVATSLLPSENISAIITMSTPHTLPPARFDSRIDDLYAKVQETLEGDPTPIISICGGAMDMMIPPESCILPVTPKNVYRRTVFTSALEGAWTGVGHREMVWCHQVRWRIARAALELGGEKDATSKASVLDSWLRNGHSLPVKASRLDHDNKLEVTPAELSTLPAGQNLVLKKPTTAKTYLLPVPEDSPIPKLTVLVSQGAIPPVLPEHAIPLRVSILSCAEGSRPVNCTSLQAETLKLIPNPIPGKPFPVPPEGADESEGVVLFETYVPRISGHNLVGVKVDNADGRGWVVASLDFDKPIVFEAITYALIPLRISIPKHDGLSTSFTFPNLLSNALVVYRLVPRSYSMSSCSEALLPPLLVHTSHPEETHYFPLIGSPDRRILLHTHLTAPFIDQESHFPSAVNFTIYSSGEQRCKEEFESFDFGIDWSATFGRWASRYLTSIVSWSAGIASLVVFLSWAQVDSRASMPTVGQSLNRYVQIMFHYLLPLSLIFSALPLPESLYLGNKGILFFAPIAPLVLLVSSGIVSLSWGILTVLLTIIGKVSFVLVGRRRENISVPRSTILSLAIICIAIFLFVPWQVAYLGCWLLHLYTCASSIPQLADIYGRQRTDAIPLVEHPVARENSEFLPDSPPRQRSSDLKNIKRDNLNHNLHLLLLMTWLLPLTAPVLAVWVRTLLTAGYTTPFDGDHNFLAVLPFLILVDYASWTPEKIFSKARFENWLPLRWLFVVMAGTAFVFGSRRPYLVVDAGRITIWIIVGCKIGRRYWGGSPWMD